MLSILISLLLFIAFENQILNRLWGLSWKLSAIEVILWQWCIDVQMYEYFYWIDTKINLWRTCISFTKLAFLLKCCDLQVERKCILHFDEICKYKIHIISRSVYQKQKLRCWGWHSTPPRDTWHISTHIYTYLDTWQGISHIASRVKCYAILRWLQISCTTHIVQYSTQIDR